MRTIALLLSLIVSLAFAGGAGAAEGTNSAGLKVSATVTRFDKKWLTVTLTLDNTSDKKIQFKNPEGEKVGGFRAKVGDRDIAAEGGKWKFTKGAGAKLMELEPGTKTDIDAKFKFDPKLAEDPTEWTLTVTNLFVDDKKVDDVVIESKPAAAPAK